MFSSTGSVILLPLMSALPAACVIVSLNGAWRLKAVLPASPSSSVVVGLNGTVLQPVVANP